MKNDEIQSNNNDIESQLIDKEINGKKRKLNLIVQNEENNQKMLQMDFCQIKNYAPIYLYCCFCSYLCLYCACCCCCESCCYESCCCYRLIQTIKHIHDKMPKLKLKNVLILIVS